MKYSLARIARVLVLSSLTIASAATLSAQNWIPYDGHRDQFTIELPETWVTHDQASMLTGKATPIGLVLFAPKEVVDSMFGKRMLPDSAAEREKAQQDMIANVGKFERGELPSFIVDRAKAGKGMACQGFTPQAQKDVEKLIGRDPIFGRGRQVIEKPTAAPAMVGACQGVRVRGSSRSKDGAESVVDARVTSDGTITYIFALRNTREYYEKNLPTFERAISSVKLTK